MQYDAIIVDASILAYSSWWNCKTLTAVVDGQTIHTGLEFGFLRNLLAHIRNNYPAKPYLAWDGRPTRGLAIEPTYKGDRDKSSHGHEAPWEPRLEVIRDTLASCITCCYHPHMEADEIIAIFVNQQEEQQKSTLIISNDGDMYQLVSDNTHIYPLGRDNEIFARPGVIAKFGVDPVKVPFYRAISGDRSDNLGGVPRISDEFKVRLANEATTIDELIESFHRASYLTQRQREKLIEGIPIVRRNYEIMNLRSFTGTLPIPVNPTGNTAPALSLCNKLEFQSLLERKEWRLLETA